MPNDLHIVFREQIKNRIPRFLIGAAIAVVIHLIFGTYLPRAVRGLILVGLPMLLYATAKISTRCSGPSCHAKLEDEERCPACDGVVVGYLKVGENHLAAEERWFAEHTP